MNVNFELHDGVDFSPPYLMLLFLPGKKPDFAFAVSDDRAPAQVVEHLRLLDPALENAFVAFIEALGDVPGERHLRLVVPPRDQEPPEPLF